MQRGERLEARFEKERENDQRRVMIIRDDYEKLKKSVKEGTFSEGKVQQSVPRANDRERSFHGL